MVISKTRYASIVIVVIILSLNVIEAQSLFDKADSFSYDSLYNLVLNSYPSVEWYGDTDLYFSYRNETIDSTCYFLVDTKTFNRTHFENKDSLKNHLPEILNLTAEKRHEHLPSSDYKKSWSADSLYYVTTYDNDLYLFRVGKNHTLEDSVRLSYDGEQFYSFAEGGNSSTVAIGNRAALGKWIGKTHKFLTVRADRRRVGTLSLVNSLSQPRPKEETYKYSMPGDETFKYEIFLVNADKEELVPIDLEKFDNQTLILPRFGNYPTTGRFAYLLRTNRAHDTLELCRLDALNDAFKVIISEECKPHLNEQLFSYRILDSGKEILWWSEKSGKGQYYLYDGEGSLKKVITPDSIVAGNIYYIDTLARFIIYEGYGGEKNINPNYRFFYKASFEGQNILLTPGDGNHEISLSPSKKFIVDTYSRMNFAPHHQICNLSGNVLFEMEPGNFSQLYGLGWKEPEVVEVVAADSVTKLYGVVYLPFDIDPHKKYPIISNVYPGPQTDLVPQSFSIDDDYCQSLAQLGFVVIKFSYRGSTPLRGKDFYTFGYENLRDYPLDDDYAVIRQVAELYPFADTNRVGIYGHSGGGFMATAAMLTRPDFYKVGIAASANHDNNIYMQQWGEIFHGVKRVEGEDGKSHFECKIPTNMELASNLKGKLLLITGDMDKNVHPANTFRMADALIRAGKRFDMMVIPGAGHDLEGRYYLNIIRYYFVENLLGLPQNDIDIIKHK